MAEPKPQEDFSKLAADLATLREDVAKLAESLTILAQQEGVAAREALKDKLRFGSARASAATADLLEDGMEKVEEAKTQAHAFCRDASGTIARNPIAAVAAALGIGFLVGMITRGR